ncbi:MAG TPA: phosphotransferase [Polyangiaceae bacterium]|nr:phosphotransferase [Polyangiaceae bacterium]
MESIVSELPPQALDWCLRQTGGVGQHCIVTRLRGGMAASTHLIESGVGTAKQRAMVLRRFVRPRTPGWPPIEQELAALAAVADCRLPYETPRVLGFDLDGSACGHPALLLTRVPGLLNLSPAGSHERASALGRALAQLHEARPRVPSELLPFEITLSQAAADGDAINWRRVRELLTTLRASADELVHGDFHLGNALFENDTLTALLDFTCARRGPWQSDVGYCRCDLSLLFGLPEAEAFLNAYESTRGLRVDALPLWDLAGALRAHPDGSAWLPGWLDAGRADLDPALIGSRLAAFVAQALARAEARSAAAIE